MIPSKIIILFSYPSTFIEKEFRKHFHEYLPSTSFLPYITDEQHFSLIRNKSFNQSIDSQSQMTQNLSTTDIRNNSTHSIQTTTELKIQPNQTEAQSENKLFIHHTHEKRFQSMKRGLHQIHKEIFSQSATKNVKMIVGNRNRRNATHELIRKRPQRSLLKNKSRPSE